MPDETLPRERAAELSYRYGQLSGAALLRSLIEREFRGRIALVSSFGTEAAVLLHMVAAIDPTVPVLFVDTGKLFGETLRYRDELIARLGLADVRTLRAAPERIDAADPDGVLWFRDANACCRLRKVEPLVAGLSGFDAWISGRKRYQGGLRTALPVIEEFEGRIKINPIADWSQDKVDAAFAATGLPPHPLLADGFLSVGCMPCTSRVASDTVDRRAGRWAGSEKTECGIHLSLDSSGL